MEIENQDGRLSNELFSFPVLNFSYIWAVHTPLRLWLELFGLGVLSRAMWRACFLLGKLHRWKWLIFRPVIGPKMFRWFLWYWCWLAFSVRRAFLDLLLFQTPAKGKGMGLEDGGSGLGGHCLATRHCGQLLQCHFGQEEVGAAGLLKRLSVLILIFLF